MAKHLPVRTMASTPAPRVITYADPAGPAAIQLVTPAQLAARQRENQLLYARWLVRQTAIAEHDRKLRRFWLGFGAVVGTAVLAAIAVAGWLVYDAITGIEPGAVVGVVGVAVVTLVGLAAAAHRCITIVQHWH